MKSRKFTHSDALALSIFIHSAYPRICCAQHIRGFCPSCHAKRLEEWGEWIRETLLLDVAHRQVVFTIPKMLRVFFKFKRRLLGDLCRCVEQETMDYLEFIARVTSHIPDKGQVTVRYYGLYANAHRGKVRKASVSPLVLRLAEEEEQRIPSKGWAEMIRKVYEIDPMVCSQCGGSMKVVAYITDYPAVDRIIDHLKLTFVAEKPPPSHVFQQVALMAAEEQAEYF